MKIVKYLILSILLMIGVLASGEIYQYYLDDFSDAYTAGFVLPGNDLANKKTMIADLEAAAARNHVHIFLMDESVSDVTDKVYNIYCSGDTKQHLIRRYAIFEGMAASLIFGSTSFRFHDLGAAPDALFTTQTTEFHISGSLEDARAFKSELINQYYGGFPRQNYSNLDDAKSFLFTVWIVILLLAVCVMIYFVLYRQKEITVRCILGEKSTTIYAVDNLCDTLVFLAVFALSLPLAQYNSGFRFFPQGTFAFAAVFLLLNWICSVRILRFNCQKAMHNIEGKSTLLAYSYVVKCISTCLAVVSICSVIPNIKNAKSFYAQEAFFQEHANDHYYYIYDTSYTLQQPDTYSAFVRELFYRTFFQDICIINEHTENTLFATPAMCTYLEQAVPEFDTAQMTETLVYLVPESCDIHNDAFLFACQTAQEFIPQGETLSEQIIPYRRAQILSIDPDTPYKSILLENPVICIVNMKEYPLIAYDEFRNDCYDLMMETGDAMICAPADKIETFASEYGVKIRLENVYKSYLYYKSLVTYTLYLSIILVLFFVLFELAVIRYIINLEYDIHAKEIAIKKVLGYRNFQCIFKIFMINILSSVAGLTAVCIVMHLLRYDVSLIVIPFLLFISFEILTTNIIMSRKIKKIYRLRSKAVHYDSN